MAQTEPPFRAGGAADSRRHTGKIAELNAVAPSHRARWPAGTRHLVFVAGTSEPGGIHVHTAEVAQACAALGCRVTILCPSVNHFVGLIADDRVAVECVPSLEEGGWRERLLRWRRPGEARPDIVFCEGKLGETSLLHLGGAAGFGRRVFTISHRPWDDPWPRRLSKKLHGRLGSILLRRMIAVSDEITASAADDFALPRRKTATCLNWVHPEFQPPGEAERSAARAASEIDPATLVIGYVGRLAPEKRIDLLLRAFATVVQQSRQPLLLLIAGEGWKRQELEALAAELGIAERVRFPGWSKTPWTVLGMCDIFVLPSLIEGFPLALMEAMAVGCPCLAHPMSSTRQLIENGKTGTLIDMTEAASLTAALETLIEAGDPYREKLGQAAAARIAAEFSRERRLPDLLAALDMPMDSLPAAVPRLLTFNRS